MSNQSGFHPALDQSDVWPYWEAVCLWINIYLCNPLRSLTGALQFFWYFFLAIGSCNLINQMFGKQSLFYTSFIEDDWHLRWNIFLGYIEREALLAETKKMKWHFSIIFDTQTRKGSGKEYKEIRKWWKGKITPICGTYTHANTGTHAHAKKRKKDQHDCNNKNIQQMHILVASNLVLNITKTMKDDSQFLKNSDEWTITKKCLVYETVEETLLFNLQCIAAVISHLVLQTYTCPQHIWNLAHTLYGHCP